MLPEVGEIVYRPMRAFKTILGSDKRISDVNFNPAKDNGLVGDIKYSFEYDAWFLSKTPGLRAFVDEEVPSNVTHFEVTKLYASAIRMRPCAPDEEWLAKQFPSANGWDQGIIRLRRIAKEEPELLRSLVDPDTLWAFVTADVTKALLMAGLGHQAAMTGSDVLQSLDTIRRFVESDFDKFGDLKDEVRATYVRVLEALVP